MTGRPSGTRRESRTRRRLAFLSVGLSLGLLAGCIPAATADTEARTASAADTEARTAIPERKPSETNQSTDTGPPQKTSVAATAKMSAVVPPAKLPVGSIATNPTTGRREVVVPDIRRTAVLIGDSQAGGSDTWPQIALRRLGYSVSFAGAGGTGFVAANEVGNANYYDSLTDGDWLLPHGDPALVVIEGGGNDAGHGASDGDILASANALVLALEHTYPTSRLVMIGTLSRSPRDGGARRAEVSALLGSLAEKRGIPFVPAGDWLTSHQLKAFLADDVHLDPRGHEKAAQVLEKSLVELKLRAADTAVDPSTHWPSERRPLE